MTVQSREQKKTKKQPSNNGNIVVIVIISLSLLRSAIDLMIVNRRNWLIKLVTNWIQSKQ